MELPCCASDSSSTPARSPAKAWFVVFTIPRHEKRVEQHLRLREIETFLPLYRKQRNWKDGSKGIVQLPLFPSYIFVRISYPSRVRVLEVPGVVTIVGGGPELVPDSYINLLRDGLRLGTIQPYPYLTTGARVRIRNGIMAGMHGILVRLKSNLRVVINLDIIMKSVTVEVNAHDVEPSECDHNDYLRHNAA